LPLYSFFLNRPIHWAKKENVLFFSNCDDPGFSAGVSRTGVQRGLWGAMRRACAGHGVQQDTMLGAMSGGQRAADCQGHPGVPLWPYFYHIFY
jgi:hypothetical protein